MNKDKKSTTEFRRGGLTLRYSLFLLSAILFIFSIAFFYTLEQLKDIKNNPDKEVDKEVDIRLGKATPGMPGDF